ncbi:MAG TPA: substrate-binding domain-containing protein [Anaeromyxobacter sp.]|nr:substrate-binding domain-containing protein [Anaeromyxobacter sp.]
MADVRIALATINMAPHFPGALFKRLQNLLKPGESIVDTITYAVSAGVSRHRLLQLLEGEPKPIALIGIVVRPEPDVVAAFRAIHAPVILIDESAPGATTVSVDNYLGGYVAGAHLAKLGRRRMVVVEGKINADGDMCCIQRLAGFKKALADHGVVLAPDHVITCPDYSRKVGADAMDHVLKKLKGVDAIFCSAADQTAVGMLTVARDRGVRIPEDIAIIGFDDLPFAATSNPPLTTVRQPLDAMAEAAYRMATVETSDVLQKPRVVKLKPELVVRQSA